MIPSQVRIFMCPEPQDMRRSFDRLAEAAREHLGEDPESGALFVFVNKRRNRVKVLWMEPGGYTLLYKRAHRVRFALPSKRTLDSRDLAVLMRGTPTRRR